MKRRFAVAATIKFVLAFLLLMTWHGSQTLLDHAKRAMGGTSFDRGHALLAPVNNYLHHHDHLANAVLIATSGHIDLVLTGMVMWGIFGETIQPTVAIFFILLFRQFSQIFVSAPIPEGMIWHYPGFPSLIVTYYTTFDFFFSGHTASATLSALEIGHRGYKNKIYVILATMMVGFEIFCILSMRFHYTADVITGIFAAVTAFTLAVKVSPKLDEMFEDVVDRVTGYKPSEPEASLIAK